MSRCCSTEFLRTPLMQGEEGVTIMLQLHGMNGLEAVFVATGRRTSSGSARDRSCGWERSARGDAVAVGPDFRVTEVGGDFDSAVGGWVRRQWPHDKVALPFATLS